MRMTQSAVDSERARGRATRAKWVVGAVSEKFARDSEAQKR
jgi:hypothetical protein